MAATLITAYKVRQAKVLIEANWDGTIANLQARKQAAQYLFEAADALEDLANKKPAGQVYDYLMVEAINLRLTARQA